MKKPLTDQQGFTIIEVVLVLAIAGLIFLMVFIALPALQRNQRDTQRKEDMSRFGSQLQNYQSNNNGKTPGATTTAWRDFVTNYLETEGDSFADPSSGSTYSAKYEGAASGTVTLSTPFKDDVTNNGQHIIHIYTGAKCNGENIEKAAGARKVAWQLKLEGSGVYCGQN